MSYDEKAMRRMKALLKVNEETGCHEWQGAVGGKNDYPSMHYRQRTRRATRVMYALTYGEIPKGMFVCHSCDNPQCVNPDHLFLGNQKRNMRDAVIKGRVKVPGLKGEDHGNAVFTNEEVIRYRKEYQAGRKLASIIAESGFTRSTVQRMLAGRTYSNLPTYPRGDSYMNNRR